jgi:hypothetical protein
MVVSDRGRSGFKFKTMRKNETFRAMAGAIDDNSGRKN